MTAGKLSILEQGIGVGKTRDASASPPRYGASKASSLKANAAGRMLANPLLSSTELVVMQIAIIPRMEDEEDEEIPVFSGRGEAFMDEVPATGSGHARRNEDIALDLMKFVAMTTGYGRTTSTGVGFQGSGSAAKPEDYAEKLLELYGRCLGALSGKK
jgi:hypothetical protein